MATYEVDVAPLVPPFSYNNLCSSSLLASFIPVFILVSAIQILFSIFQVVMFTSIKYVDIPQNFRRMMFGIFWPEYWSSNTHSEENHELLLKTDRIVTNDILNPLLVLCTFGICSPFLSLVILVTVSLKCRLWIMLLGRFLYARLVPSISNNSTGGEDAAVVMLSEACIPVVNVVARCLWPIIWSSSLFFAILCWDVLGDEIGWRKAIWAPLFVISLPVVLWIIVFFYNYSFHSARSTSPSISSTASFSEDDSRITSSNPLHKTKSIRLSTIARTSSNISKIKETIDEDKQESVN